MPSLTGRHLLVDAYDGDPALLGNCELVEWFLAHYPGVMGMTIIAGPYVHEHHGANEEDWGVTGFVVIAESHVSIHTFPERRALWADIFSCREFDTAHALRSLKEAFGLRQMKSNTIQRALPEVLQLSA